jgi:hypothetical protein
MAESRMTIGAIAVGAWRDGLAALSAQRGVTLAAFLALTLINLLPHLWLPVPDPAALKPGADPLSADMVSRLIGNGLITLVSALVAALALAPLAIAIHRFILLDETTSSYRIELGERRFRRFALFTFVLQMIAMSPAALAFLFLAVIKRIPPAAMVLLGLGLLVAMIAGAIVILVLTVRLTLLFPAVAVDAPRAGWNRALDESRGHFWRILLALLLTGLIGILVIIGTAVFQGVGAFLITHGYPAPGAVVSSVAQAASNVLMAAAFVAAASRLYRDFTGQSALPTFQAA